MKTVQPFSKTKEQIDKPKMGVPNYVHTKEEKPCDRTFRGSTWFTCALVDICVGIYFCWSFLTMFWNICLKKNAQFYVIISKNVLKCRLWRATTRKRRIVPVHHHILREVSSYIRICDKVVGWGSLTQAKKKFLFLLF